MVGHPCTMPDLIDYHSYSPAKENPMSTSRPIPIDILDDLSVLDEPSCDEFERILQDEIDSLGFELFIRNQLIADLKQKITLQDRILLAYAHVSEWELHYD